LSASSGLAVRLMASSRACNTCTLNATLPGFEVLWE
jgi:hypothetical protein